MEELKSINEIHIADGRNLNYIKWPSREAVTFEDRYNEISRIKIVERAPEDVKSYFETIKNLYLYSWYVYSFYAIVEFLTYTAIEMALRLRFKKEDPDGKLRFKHLINKAIKEGLLKEDGFSHVKRIKERRSKFLEEIKKFKLPYNPRLPIDYCKGLEEAIPKLRNTLAHPRYQEIQMPHNALFSIEIAAEFINQLF